MHLWYSSSKCCRCCDVVVVVASVAVFLQLLNMCITSFVPGYKSKSGIWFNTSERHLWTLRTTLLFSLFASFCRWSPFSPFYFSFIQHLHTSLFHSLRSYVVPFHLFPFTVSSSTERPQSYINEKTPPYPQYRT